MAGCHLEKNHFQKWQTAKTSSKSEHFRNGPHAFFTSLSQKICHIFYPHKKKSVRYKSNFSFVFFDSQSEKKRGVNYMFQKQIAQCKEQRIFLFLSKMKEQQTDIFFREAKIFSFFLTVRTYSIPFGEPRIELRTAWCRTLSVFCAFLQYKNILFRVHLNFENKYFLSLEP